MTTTIITTHTIAFGVGVHYAIELTTHTLRCRSAGAASIRSENIKCGEWGQGVMQEEVLVLFAFSMLNRI